MAVMAFKILSSVAVFLVSCIATPAHAKSKLAGALETQAMPINEYAAQVSGQLPSWLRGTMIRNVPNVYEMGSDQVRAWTDPLASIHLIKFNGTGAVMHAAKNLETPAYTAAVQHNGFPFKQFYTPKNPGPRPTGGHVPFPCSGGPCLPDPNNATLPPVQEQLLQNESLKGWKPGSVVGVNPNVDIARYVTGDGSELYLALTDQNVFTAFSGSDATTTSAGPCPWSEHDELCKDFFSNNLLSAAHEKFDYNTGEHFNFVQRPQTVPGLTHSTVRLSRFKDGADDFARWAGPEHRSTNVSFIHSSHLTEQYFIVQQPPVNMVVGAGALKETPFNFSTFDPSVSVQWHVLDRNTGDRKALVSAQNTKWLGPNPGLSRQTFFRGQGHPGAFFHTHTLNAFERGDELVMDFIGFPDNSIFYGIGLELMIDNPRDYMETWEPARFTRCTVSLSNSSVECEVLVDVNFGLPCFNVEKYQMKDYRYAYGTSIRDKSTTDFVDRLIKVDITERRVVAEWYANGTFVTEPVFVAEPDGTAEDDGVLISTIFDSAVQTSFLVVLDAHDMKEIARVNLNYKVQAHFHGKFCKAYGDFTCVGL